MKTHANPDVTENCQRPQASSSATGYAPFDRELKAYEDGRKARAAGLMPPPVNYGTSYETAWMLGWKAHNDKVSGQSGRKGARSPSVC
jgi:hypothetical protein